LVLATDPGLFVGYFEPVHSEQAGDCDMIAPTGAEREVAVVVDISVEDRNDEYQVDLGMDWLTVGAGSSFVAFLHDTHEGQAEAEVEPLPMRVAQLQAGMVFPFHLVAGLR
jgi:hypothetical protein